jgi:predicted dehydrogenase
LQSLPQSIDGSPPIGIGIIGAGARGVRFAGKGFGARPECAIVAAVDPDPTRLEVARDELGDIAATTSLDDFLATPGLDAVVIASPEPFHADQALAALTAGKHVYLEKPMAQTIADCDRIAEAAVASGKVVMVGLELRRCSLFEDLKKLIDSGLVGKIILGDVVDNVSVGGTYYYHGYQRHREVVKTLMLEKGTHTIDLINWLLDATPTRVYSSAGLDVFGAAGAMDALGYIPSPDKRCHDCEIAATCPYYVDRRTGVTMDYGGLAKRGDGCVWASDIDTDDNGIALIDYDSGARVAYTECHFTPEYTREFSFTGTKGKITAFFDNEQNFRITFTERHTGETTTWHPERRPGGHGGSDQAIIDEFIRLVLAGQPATPGLLGARDSAAIALAAAESAATGQPVDIAPASWVTAGTNR